MSKRTRVYLEPNEVDLVLRALHTAVANDLFETDQEDTDAVNLADYIRQEAGR